MARRGPRRRLKIVTLIAAESRSECLERNDGIGFLDAWNDLDLFVDEMADVGTALDVEFDQQVVVAGGRIDLRGNFGFRKRIGDGIRLAKLAFDLNKERDHRCFSRQAVL